jgi:transglutaminase-like putative cysteine protease
MSSDRALRVCMQLLVLLDLVFVHLTGSADESWLAPLFVLALAAPLLERFRERLVYRWAWNTAIVAVFGRLVGHFVDGRLGHVLEDGLVLAALCQVHLLNNLRSSQRPDLLFFNAFQIATVAGYLSDGIGFPIVFLAFVPTFVVGLQLLSAASAGSAIEPRATRRLVVDGARRSVWLLALSASVFLFWPRDFERKAFFHDRLELASDAPHELQVGFSEVLDLDRRGIVGVSDAEVLRVTLLEGERRDVPLLWRGATLSATTGGAWMVGPAVQRRNGEATDPAWRGSGGRLERPKSGEGAGPRVEVLRRAQETERLFAPLGAQSMHIVDEPHRRLRPRGDGTVDVGGTEDVRYVLRLEQATIHALGGAPREVLPPELAQFVVLPVTDRIRRAQELARRLAAQLEAGADQCELVAHLSEHLSSSYTYVAPGTEGAANTLDTFLKGVRGGHCEFFASALATMLRSLDVPCRVVTGYRSNAWDAAGRVLSFGARDAHAWVEVHDPNAGWYAVDPSPRRAHAATEPSLWSRVTVAARSVWSRVTGFDAERRASSLAWLRARPAALAQSVRDQPITTSLALALVVLFVAVFVQRRRARTPAAIREYRAALRRSKLVPLSGETPRELLTRARRCGVPLQRLAELEHATQRHEARRYAG